MAARSKESPVQYVQLDGLVALKIIKHCQEEGSGTDIVQGVLLGLVENNRLEITNCFPFPKNFEDDDFDERLYQMEMMRHLRHVNVDHLHVGWYQSTYFGSFINKVLLHSQYEYQHTIEESVVLVYDPLKTAKGHLSLKALRLTPAIMDLYRDQDFTPDSIAKSGINFQAMFEEVPVVVKSSHLNNAMLCEVEEQLPQEERYNFLDLATSSVMEKNLRLMMESVDELVQDTNKFYNYQRQSAKHEANKKQYLQKRKIENDARRAKKEAPLPEEDLNKIFKPIQPPSRLESLVLAGQIASYADQVSEFAGQSFGKLFMAEALNSGKGQAQML